MPFARGNTPTPVLSSQCIRSERELSPLSASAEALAMHFDLNSTSTLLLPQELEKTLVAWIAF